MIEDYSYKGAYFCENSELPLPQGEEWDDQGKKDTIHHVFNFSILFNFYFVILRHVKMFYADVGPVRLAGMLSIDRRVGVRDMVAYFFEVDEELEDLEENPQRLTLWIPDITTDDLPR